MKQKTRFLIIFVLPLLLIACKSQPGQEKVENEKQTFETSIINRHTAAFYGNLATLCGKSFAGKEVYMQEGRESWAHLPMIMHVTICDENELHIPFHVGEDKSRTWMFIIEEGLLRFRHDHRHEDGTPEDLTLYGGYATENGTPFRQEFPADEYTIDVHPRSTGAVWVVELTDNLSKFSYQLHHEGILLFHADFDLTQEK